MSAARTTSLLLPFATLLAAFAWPSPAAAQVHRCVTPDGNVVYTDRSCASIGAVASAVPQSQSATRLYHGRCAATLQDLVYEVTSAIDSRDVNRLAAHYHWPGLSGAAANATMDRLDAIASRPLLDLRIVTADVPVPGSPADPMSLPRIRVTPIGLRAEQLTGEGGTPVATAFSLQRHIGCWWVRF